MTTLSFLNAPLPRLLFFGGKGGVGKTSLAAATSLSLAQLHPQQRIMVASTDPAHSLADGFGCALGPVPSLVYDQPNLFGLEIDAQAALRAFLAEHGKALGHILSRGTYLADEDISRLLDLQFPGLDEMMVLLQILEFLSAEANTTLVVDTAPTGHTLRLLELPSVVDTWVKFLDTLLDKHRYLARLYTGRYDPDAADALLEALAHDITRLRRLLQDCEHTQFVAVAVPETVVLAETVRLIQHLAEIKVSVKYLLVNRVLPPSSSCALWTARQRAQTAHLQGLAEMFPNLSWMAIPLLPREARGQLMLTRLAGVLVVPPDRPHAAGIEADELSSSPVIQDISPHPPIAPVAIAPPTTRVKLLLFGGKGGVGKTSLACAMALQLARRSPEKRVLLFSTDPAHSLADCLGQPIGEHTTAVRGQANLFVCEINPTHLFEAFRHTYVEEMAALFVAVTAQGQLDVPFDRQVMTHLMDLIPPGIDEIMSLIEIISIVRHKAYDYYILDNAPTGHLLRFLELPELMQDWVRIFFLLILKYSRVAQLPNTSTMLVQMSKDLKVMRRLFTSPTQCEFMPVAIPTVMSLHETRRLLTHLAQLNIHCQRLLINQVWLCVDGCEECASLHHEEQDVITRYHQEFPALDVVTLPWLPSELTGVETLAQVFRLTTASVRH